MKYRPAHEIQIYTGKYPKEPEPKVLMDKKILAIVDRHNNVAHDREGNLLLFTRRRDAAGWIENQEQIPSGWKVIPVDISVTTTLSV